MRAVNLLPQEQRRVQASGARKGSAYVVLGVLAVLLAMAVGYVATANKVTSRESDAASARAEADRLEARARELGSFTNFAQIKQTRLASVSGVAASRFDWERVMRELSRLMPTGSWLQTTNASVTGETDESSTSTSTTTSSSEPGTGSPSLNLVGCTPHQSDVAQMMVRLRQMHRASDVELNESARETSDTGEAGVDNCGRFYNFDLTVTFSAVAPVTQVPRGAVRVPASLGGGS
jgi:Tfp pilus assembly protein PilN